ncbi:MAG TPA: phage virion morphogenesis protein [Xanthobacteraceae bacterium]|nr:phage virion morphogenesis protein [Xanthobacteraceae bacterium]
MATEGIRIVVDDAEVQAGLSRLAAAGGALAPAMADIGSAMLASTQRRFEAEAGLGGVKWQPFAPSTLKRMSAKRRARPLLLRDKVSPGLYSSLTTQSDEHQVQVGTNLRYAAIHQFGGEVKLPERQQTSSFRYAAQGAGRTKDGRRVGSRLRFAKASSRAKSRHERTFTVGAHSVTIPARPYLGIDDQDRAEIAAILEQHLRAATDAEGRR